MPDNPIKFPSSPSSSEDDLTAHQASEKDVSTYKWMPSYCSPPLSSEEDPEEEDEDDDEEDDADATAAADDSDDSNFDDSDSDFDSPPPK